MSDIAEIMLESLVMQTNNQKENLRLSVKEISNNCFEIHKEIGETPLAALERFRSAHPEFRDLPMTYAGRLDPMAEGALIILVGEECKNKEKYLDLDKEYEVEVVFGVGTDTYDALGLVVGNDGESNSNPRNYLNILESDHASRQQGDETSQRATEGDSEFVNSLVSKIDLSAYVGKFSQEYPPYSSKTVGGIQLHELARKDELPEKMPENEVEIYSIEAISRRVISGAELFENILHNVSLIKGDFRQSQIIARWQEVLGASKTGYGKISTDSSSDFEILKIRVKCSSGTYMRSLAHRMGKNLGAGAFVLSINRTKYL
jgi:tRNA pseudouridine55 synthase